VRKKNHGKRRKRKDTQHEKKGAGKREGRRMCHASERRDNYQNKNEAKERLLEKGGWDKDG